MKALLESGPVPGYSADVADDAARKRKLESDDKGKKKSKQDWTGKPAEMERLAAGLQKLGHEDLLQVVQLVTEHKTSDMYVKNDVEGKDVSILRFT